MLRVLIPIDGSSACDRAIRHVIALNKSNKSMEVHLVNVQEAQAALRSAKRKLDRAGMTCETHVLMGDAVIAIAQLAKRGRFDQITIATKGLRLTALPVTLVK